MADKHTDLGSRPRALTIEALRHDGYAIREAGHEHRGPGFDHAHVAAFTRLTDAVGWIEEQMRLPSGDDEPRLILRKG